MRLPTLPWFVECLEEHPQYSLLAAPVELCRGPVAQEIVTGPRLWVDVQRGDATDSFIGPPASMARVDGVVRPFLRQIGCEALFHAVSLQDGARRQDHLEACDAAVNAFVWLAYEVARESECIFTPMGGGSVVLEGEATSLASGGSAEAGARYLLRFTLAVPIASPRSRRVAIGPPPDVTIASTHVVPFNEQDWP